MVKKDGYYYLLYSEGACCGSKCDYDVRVARSKSLKGPYEKYSKNSILTANDTWKCPGHGTIVKTDNDKWIYMYHAYSQKSDIYTGRQGLIDEIVWESGWPLPNNENGPSKNSKTPYNPFQKIDSGFNDVFNNKTLSKSWQWDFRSSEPLISLNNNTLSLAGNPKEKNIAGTALTVRPFYRSYSIETSVSNKNDSLKGLTIYGDSNQCIGIGVTKNDIQLWEVRDNKRNILSKVTIEDHKNLQLKISIENDECSFYWKIGNKWVPLKVEGKSTINGSFLPQWDRSPRPGLIHYGDKEKPAIFNYFRIIYNQ